MVSWSHSYKILAFYHPSDCAKLTSVVGYSRYCVCTDEHFTSTAVPVAHNRTARHIFMFYHLDGVDLERIRYILLGASHSKWFNFYAILRESFETKYLPVCFKGQTSNANVKKPRFFKHQQYKWDGEKERKRSDEIRRESERIETEFTWANLTAKNY